VDKWLPVNWSSVYVLIDFMIGMTVNALNYLIIKRSRIALMLFVMKPKAKKIGVLLEEQRKFDTSALIVQN